jgi:hypothetical protein
MNNKLTFSLAIAISLAGSFTMEAQPYELWYREPAVT